MKEKEKEKKNKRGKGWGAQPTTEKKKGGRAITTRKWRRKSFRTPGPDAR
jgi:hypothetical protein